MPPAGGGAGRQEKWSDGANHPPVTMLAEAVIRRGGRVEFSDPGRARGTLAPVGTMALLDLLARSAPAGPAVGPGRAPGAGRAAVVKRLIDVVGAVVGLVLLTPLALVLAVLIMLDSPGSALFRQERLGKDGQAFQMLKFRTMVREAPGLLVDLRTKNEADGPLFKISRDPRVTRIGRALRRTSLDEVPQLWNVLKGEMSLVGPRPALPAEVAGWTPELYQRLRVKPGLTGMWQVNGRSSVSFDEYARLDLYYVNHWSIATDLAILAKTLPAVLSGRGAS